MVEKIGDVKNDVSIYYAPPNYKALQIVVALLKHQYLMAWSFACLRNAWIKVPLHGYLKDNLEIIQIIYVLSHII